METGLIILSILCYLASCVFFGFIACFFSKTMDDSFTVKNLLISITWPISMWFLK